MGKTIADAESEGGTLVELREAVVVVLLIDPFSEKS